MLLSLLDNHFGLDIIAIPINMIIDTTSLGNVQIVISEESVHTASDGTWYNTIETF